MCEEMNDDLKARLRGRSQFCRDRGEVKSPELLEEAADRIEALVKERDELRAFKRYWSAEYDVVLAGRADAEDRVEALEQQIADLLADVPCACGYDNPTDVCMKHFPLIRKLMEQIETAEPNEKILQMRKAYVEASREQQHEETAQDTERKLRRAVRELCECLAEPVAAHKDVDWLVRRTVLLDRYGDIE